jgi:lipoprotein-anchoring transpeptidase ErfK/SrfK
MRTLSRALAALAMILPLVAEPAPGGSNAPTPVPGANQPDAEPVAAPAILVTKRELTAQLQIFLDQQMFSPGMIDGVSGPFLTKALKRWKRAHGLPETVTVDENVPMDGVYPVYTFHTVAKEDRQFIGDLPGKTSAQARKKYLPYPAYLDFVAERYHSSREFITRLNPGMRFEKLEPGDRIRVPNVEPFKIEEMPPTGNFPVQPELLSRTVVINRRETMLDVLEGGRLLASIPIAPGSPAHPTPPGKWRVLGVASMPTFRWDQGVLQRGVRTKNFYMLPAGPRNPVGVAWIGLNKPGIGIHGTNNPYSVGTFASHGCMRTANWDIARLCRMVTVGTTIEIR